MERSFQKSLLYSTLLHAAILLAFLFLYQSFLVVRTPLLMELTLIGRMPQGNDLGTTTGSNAPSVVQSQAAENTAEIPSPRLEKAEVPVPDNTKPQAAVKKPLKTARRSVTASPEAALRKLRRTAPIGINPTKEVTSQIETTAGLGHTGVAGAPDGNASIEGELAARGIKRQVNPTYPAWAKKQGIEAVIKFQLTVLPSGFLKEDEIQMEQTSGYRDLDHDAYNALIQWEFEPLPQEATQINQSGVITFVFNLKNN
jgi:TonB family protein